MKKCLLTLATIAISIAGYGQTSTHALPGSKSLSFDSYKKSISIAEKNMELGNASSKATPTPSVARHGGQNQTSAVCNVLPIGHASNSLGATGGGRTQVWWDQN